VRRAASLTLALFMTTAMVTPAISGEGSFVLPDTGQTACYDDSREIACPAPGEPFYGQDAQASHHPLSYTVSADGLTVLDNVTGLTWTKSPDWNQDGAIDSRDKTSWSDAQAFVDKLNAENYGGYDDWRLPSIKELYSLIDFDGVDISGPRMNSASVLKRPFIDTDAFDFDYGDVAAGERPIDAQYWSSTAYTGTTMRGDHTVFGVNFADGRIKGYPTVDPRTRGDKTEYVRYVRGNTEYGINDFVDNGDGTITDLATGLMWQLADSGAGYNWNDALAYADDLVLAGHDDWRLPTAKELQSIVDYSRSLQATGTAAIDPVFTSTVITNEGGAADYGSYWTSTTHLGDGPQPGGFAVYVTFGEALGFMPDPFGSGVHLMDVHGAGAQRSDPKVEDGKDYSQGHGPQGDVVRIDNLVRAVRTAG